MIELGISFKTQALYVAVFVTRYLDLFLGEWVSLCNTLMKLFFIGSSCYILYLMKYRFRSVVATEQFVLHEYCRRGALLLESLRDTDEPFCN